MEWTSIMNRRPQPNQLFKEVVICYRDDKDSYWESLVINIDNLDKCEWGELYWMPLPQPPKDKDESPKAALGRHDFPISNESTLSPEWGGEKIKVKTSHSGWVDMVDELNRLEAEKNGMG